MKNMTLSNIAKACNGTMFNTDMAATSEVRGIVLDSRLVERDYVFIASRGERVDGHDYVKAAAEQGAIAVVCSLLQT